MENKEKFFNILPDIDTSGSDDFKEISELVKEHIVHLWKDYTNLNISLSATEDLEEGEEVVDEDATLNMVPITRKDEYYLKSRYHSVDKDINLVEDIFSKLVKKVIIYTNKDLINQIILACKWFNRTNISNYTGILEYTCIGKFKSKDWILHEAMKYLKIQPNCIINYKNIKAPGTYLIMDDGVYSGTQLSAYILDIMEQVKSCVIYIAIMYMAEIGLNVVLSNNRFSLIQKEEYQFTIKYTYKINGLPENKNKIIYLWKGYNIIPSIPKILSEFTSDEKFIKRFHSILLENCGSIVIFEHKIPDYKSLPWILANIFYKSMYKHYLATPPYAPHDKSTFKPGNTNYKFKCFHKSSWLFGKRKLVKKRFVKFKQNLKIINSEITYLCN